MSRAKICHLLVDMDSVIVNWDGTFLERWIITYPEDKELIQNRKLFEIEQNFPEQKRDEVIRVITTPGFYAAMKPIEGAVEALKEILSLGYDVRLCTSPDLRCAPACAAEKFQWVAQHLGDEWMSRLIISRDKTHVKGKLLVDDKPHVQGSSTSTWEHVLFDAPYNRDIADGRRRLVSWSMWRDVLEEPMNKD